MASLPENVHAIVALRDGAETGTAITSTDADVLATDLLDARIESFKQGLFVLQVEAADDGDADETYSVALLGRDVGSGSYTTLATIAPARGSGGLGFHMESVDGFKKRLNYSVTVTGTTPSLTFSAHVVVLEATYQPLNAAVITA